MVCEHRRRRVAQVLFRQRSEQLQRPPGASFPARFAQEIHDLAVVASRCGYEPGDLAGLHSDGAGERIDGRLCGERGDIGVADGVFAVEAAVVFRALGGRHLRQIRALGRGNDVDGKGEFVADRVIQRHRRLRLPPERDLPDAEPPVADGRDEHVAQSCRQRRLSPAVGRFARHGEELGVIVKFELHGRTLHGTARRVGDRHGERSACGIVRNHIDFGVVGRGFHHLLRAVVITEDLGVHQHPAAGRGVEPPQVEHRFRLAGPEEMPPSVGPGLDPGVVVVGVRPAGRVDLPGRNAHRAQRRDEQRRLLAAAAVGRAHGGQRRTGPRIRRLVVGLFVTPVVHFEDGVVHRQPFDARRQLVVEHPARIVEVLVVHPHGQHEMPEQFVGNDVSPRHFPAGGQRAAHVFQIKIARVVGHVPHGHIGIKEHHGFALLPRHRFVEYPEQIAPGKQFLFVAEIGLHAPHETLVAGRGARRQHAREYKQAGE